DLAGAIDDGGDSVGRGAENVALRLDGPHTGDEQVLVARGRWAVPTVVRNVDQRFGAGGDEFGDPGREHVLVADVGRNRMLADRRHDDLVAGVKIAGFERDL